MGLDISVYKDLKSSNDEDCRFNVFNAECFKGRNTSIEYGLYTGDKIYDFRAGSYIAYNGFRRALANLINLTPETVWENQDKFIHTPFYEIINFSDCEGSFDVKTCSDLYIDFIDYKDKAEKEMGEWHYEIYNDFIEALKLTIENKGILIYH